MKYRSMTQDDNWMGFSCLLSCRYGSHWRASKYQGEIVDVMRPEIAK